MTGAGESYGEQKAAYFDPSTTRPTTIVNDRREEGTKKTLYKKKKDLGQQHDVNSSSLYVHNLAVTRQLNVCMVAVDSLLEEETPGLAASYLLRVVQRVGREGRELEKKE